MRRTGDPQGQGTALCELAPLLIARGDVTGALASYDEALSLVRPIGDVPTIGTILNNRSQLAADLGRHAEAVEGYHEALTILGDSEVQSVVLRNLAGSELALGNPAKALSALLAELRLHLAWNRRDGAIAAVEHVGRVIESVDWEVSGQTDAAATVWRHVDNILRDDRVLALKAEQRLGEALRDSELLVATVDYHEKLVEQRREADDREGEDSAVDTLARLLISSGRRDEGITAHRHSLAVHRERRDRQREAGTLNQIARLLQAAGHLDDALEQYGLALKVAEESGERRMMGSILSNSADVLSQRGRTNEAADAYGAALAVRQEVGDRTGERITLTSRARMFEESGRHAEALDDYLRARLILNELGDAVLEVSVISMIAELLHSLGRPEEALMHYEEAIALAERLGDGQAVIKARNGLVKALLALSRNQEAADQNLRAAEGFMAADDLPNAARAIANHGEMLIKLGQTVGGVQQYEHALELFRVIANPGEELAVRMRLGVLLHDLDRSDDALDQFESAVQLARTLADADREYLALSNSGALLVRLDRGEEALDRFRAALLIARGQDERAEEASTLAAIAEALYRLDSTATAFDHFGQALHILQQLGDAEAEAELLWTIANRHYEVKNWDEALRHAETVLALYESLGNHKGQAGTHWMRARILRAVDRPDEELASLEAALACHRRNGEQTEQAAALHELALVFKKLGRVEDALAHFKQARSIRHELNDPAEAVSLAARGLLLHELGRFREALDDLEPSVAIARQRGDVDNLAPALNDLGMVLDGLGRYGEALDRYDEALSLRREAEDDAGVVATLSNIASVTDDLGRPQEALYRYSEAIDICRRVGDRKKEGKLLNNAALVMADMGRPDQALESCREALEIAQAVGDLGDEAATLGNIGTLLSRTGDLDGALHAQEDALSLFRELKQIAGTGTAMNNLASTLRALGRHEEAMRHYQNALALLGEAGDRWGQLITHANAAEAHHEQHELSTARAHLESAIMIAEEIRSEIGARDLRESLGGTLHTLYATYALLLLDQDEPEKAFGAAEQSRARSFVELLDEIAGRALRAIDPDLAEQRLELVQRLRAANARRGPREVEQEIAELERRLYVLDARIWRDYPDLHSVREPRALDVAEVRATLLGERSALLAYVLAADVSLLFVVSPKRLAVHRLPGDHEIEPLVRELHAAVQSDDIHRYPHGNALYRLLIGPAEELLADEGIDSLIIAPDGLLHQLPFSVLLTEAPDGHEAATKHTGPILDPAERLQGFALRHALEQRLPKQPYNYRTLPYLVRRFAITHVISVSAQLTHRRATQHRTGRQFIGFGDPTGLEELFSDDNNRGASQHGPALLDAACRPVGTGLTRLPNAIDEVVELARMFSPDVPDVDAGALTFDDPRVAVRIGASATKREFLHLVQSSGGVRFLHLATHGLLDDERPQFSGLIFSPAEPTDLEPLLEAFEVLGLDLRADIVCLSACDTGLGRLVRGEGTVGLARSFLHAGASALCVSLWQVRDASTATLMRLFYRGLVEGDPAAAAMRTAQLRLIEGEHPAPVHWAPFIIMS